MKKTFLAIIIAVVAVGTATSQRREVDLEQEWRWEKKRKLVNTGFSNISYSMQKMVDAESGLESDHSEWGVAFTKGRTFVMHRKPLAELIYFGLDAVWLDINYAQYRAEMEVGGGTPQSEKVRQADVAMGVGPSVHVTPIGNLGIHTYFRYMPTFCTYFGDEVDGVMGGYASMFTTGGAVSWSVISLGVEARWGAGKYKLLASDEESLYIPKLKTSGMRAYISLRF